MIFVSLVVATVASAARVDAGAAGLTATQIRQLQALPLPIAVPGYVPPGFRLVHFETIRARPGMPENGYTLVYRSNGGREFRISVTDRTEYRRVSIGDPAPPYKSFQRKPFVVNSPLLGPANMTPDGPLGYSGDRSLDRLGNRKANLSFSGTKMSQNDLKRIYASLGRLAK